MTKYKLVLVPDVNRLLKKGWLPDPDRERAIVDSATGLTYVWIYKT